MYYYDEAVQIMEQTNRILREQGFKSQFELSLTGEPILMYDKRDNYRKLCNFIEKEVMYYA